MSMTAQCVNLILLLIHVNRAAGTAHVMLSLKHINPCYSFLTERHKVITGELASVLLVWLLLHTSL